VVDFPAWVYPKSINYMTLLLLAGTLQFNKLEVLIRKRVLKNNKLTIVLTRAHRWYQVRSIWFMGSNPFSSTKKVKMKNLKLPLVEPVDLIHIVLNLPA